MEKLSHVIVWWNILLHLPLRIKMMEHLRYLIKIDRYFDNQRGFTSRESFAKEMKNLQAGDNGCISTNHFYNRLNPLEMLPPRILLQKCCVEYLKWNLTEPDQLIHSQPSHQRLLLMKKIWTRGFLKKRKTLLIFTPLCFDLFYCILER